MYLTPSKILYTHRDPEINSTTERAFCEMAKSIHSSTVFPKLQVVKKDGFYFTLNDAKLQVYRHLEKLGRCGRVEVEKIALKEVPEGIQNLMTAPDTVPNFKGRKSKDKLRKGKYQSISTSANTEINVDDSLVLSKCSEEDECEVESDVTEESESDTSEDDSSEWSDEDISDTDVETSDDQKEEDETNCEENESFI